MAWIEFFLSLLSMTTTVLTQCQPTAPCTSCTFLTIERHETNCQIYHYCYYGRIWLTLRCDSGQIYSKNVRRCIPRESINYDCVSQTPTPPRRGPISIDRMPPPFQTPTSIQIIVGHYNNPRYYITNPTARARHTTQGPIETTYPYHNQNTHNDRRTPDFYFPTNSDSRATGKRGPQTFVPTWSRTPNERRDSRHFLTNPVHNAVNAVKSHDNYHPKISIPTRGDSFLPRPSAVKGKGYEYSLPNFPQTDSQRKVSRFGHPRQNSHQNFVGDKTEFPYNRIGPDDVVGRAPANSPLRLVTPEVATTQEPFDKSPFDEKCGIKVSRLIARGQRAERAEWAWQVSLQVYDIINQKFVHICGGTIIHTSWVLTAAHCVYSRDQKVQLTIVAGQQRLDSRDPWRQEGLVTQTEIHPNYLDHGNFPNDIALLRMHMPFNLTTAVRPACMPKKGKSPHFDTTEVNKNYPDSNTLVDIETDCWTTGWGDSKATIDPDSLREIKVKVVELWRCNKRWPGYVKTFHICATSLDGTACKGDSGGPLVCVKDGRYFLQGVVSWGDGTCQLKEQPNIYTRVTSYIDWITDTINSHPSRN